MKHLVFKNPLDFRNYSTFFNINKVKSYITHPSGPFMLKYNENTFKKSTLIPKRHLIVQLLKYNLNTVLND